MSFQMDIFNFVVLAALGPPASLIKSSSQKAKFYFLGENTEDHINNEQTDSNTNKHDCSNWEPKRPKSRATPTPVPLSRYSLPLFENFCPPFCFHNLARISCCYANGYNDEVQSIEILPECSTDDFQNSYF